MNNDNEWHEWRRQGIGASEIAAVLGISPWAGPWTVWARKVGLVPEQEATEEMDFGKWAERMIVPWFTDRTGLHVFGQQTWCANPDRPWMRCTVDGFVGESPDTTVDDALGLLEIKTTGAGNWDELPDHYVAQVQWQMAVTGAERVWVAHLHGRRLDITEVQRDQPYIDEMIYDATMFWEQCVLIGDPPRPTADDLDALTDAWPDRMPESATDLPAELVEQWEFWRKHRIGAQKNEDAAKADLLAALGDHEIGVVDGVPVVTYKAQTRPSYVVKESTYRVLRTVKSKESAA